MKQNIIKDMEIYQILKDERQLEKFLSNRYINLSGITVFTTTLNLFINSQFHFFEDPINLCLNSFFGGILLEALVELIIHFKRQQNLYKKKTIIENLNAQNIAVSEDSFDNYYQVSTEIETNDLAKYFNPENILEINKQHKRKTLKLKLNDTLTFDSNSKFIIIRETVPKHIKGIKQTEVIYVKNEEEEEKTKKLYRVNHK